MSAAGRLSNATSIHPGRPCGPECSICSKVPSDKRFTPGSMLSDWQKLHTCISITSGQCIKFCWKCVKALRQRKKISHQSAKAHAVYMIAAQRHTYTMVHCPADKLHVHSLKEQCEAVLCPAHYLITTTSTRQQQCVGHGTCAWCKSSRGSPHHTGGSHQTFSLQSMCCIACTMSGFQTRVDFVDAATKSK